MPLIARTICSTVVAALMFIRGDLLWFIVEWGKQHFTSALISFTVLCYTFLTTVWEYPIVEQSTNSRQAISCAPATFLHVTFQVLCRTHMVNLPDFFSIYIPIVKALVLLRQWIWPSSQGRFSTMCFLTEEGVPAWYICTIRLWGCLISLNNFSPRKESECSEDHCALLACLTVNHCSFCHFTKLMASANICSNGWLFCM